MVSDAAPVHFVEAFARLLRVQLLELPARLAAHKVSDEGPAVVAHSRVVLAHHLLVPSYRHTHREGESPLKPVAYSLGIPTDLGCGDV